MDDGNGSGTWIPAQKLQRLTGNREPINHTPSIIEFWLRDVKRGFDFLHERSRRKGLAEKAGAKNPLKILLRHEAGHEQ
jgi:hypothetical protein